MVNLNHIDVSYSTNTTPYQEFVQHFLQVVQALAEKPVAFDSNEQDRSNQQILLAQVAPTPTLPDSDRYGRDPMMATQNKILEGLCLSSTAIVPAVVAIAVLWSYLRRK